MASALWIASAMLGPFALATGPLLVGFLALRLLQGGDTYLMVFFALAMLILVPVAWLILTFAWRLHRSLVVSRREASEEGLASLGGVHLRLAACAALLLAVGAGGIPWLPGMGWVGALAAIPLAAMALLALPSSRRFVDARFDQPSPRGRSTRPA